MRHMKALVAAGAFAVATLGRPPPIFPAPVRHFRFRSTPNGRTPTKTGVNLNYQSIGSGGGIKHSSQDSDLPATMPLRGRTCKGGSRAFPTVLGGSCQSSASTVSPPVTSSQRARCRAFSWEIKSWDDAAIINPKQSCRHRRSLWCSLDGSGTTFIFTDYLAKTNAN